ncbi:hypothetical protein [Modestobacter lapidis]|nr:hypothetical protein [Modestobacter lapidis]
MHVFSRPRLASRLLATCVVAVAVLAGAPSTALADPVGPPTTATAEPAPTATAEPATNGDAPDAAPIEPSPREPATTPAPEPAPATDPAPATEPTPTTTDPAVSDPAVSDPAMAPEPTGNPIEAGDTVTGTVQRAYADDFDTAHRHGAHLLTWIETAAGETVHVPDAELSGIAVQATVQATVGEPVAQPAGLPAGTPPVHELQQVEVLAAAPATPAATPTNAVTIAMVVPAGATQDATSLADVVDLFTDTVAPWWSTQSNGTIRLAVTATHDWMTSSATCADATSMWTEVASRIGWTPGAGKHLFTYLPADTPGCGGLGLGSVGSGPASGGRSYVRGIHALATEHEFGHNFGLWHSGRTDCGDAIESGTCSTVEYGDDYDVMGNYHDGTLNVVQAARIGLLPPAQQQALASSATGGAYTLAPVSGASGIRGIKLTDASGAVYWLEYRIAGGADSWLADRSENNESPYGAQSGVLLRKAGTSPSSILLDPTPLPRDPDWPYDYEYAFPVGTGTSFGGGAFTVTVQNTTAAAATLWIATRTTAAAPAATAVQQAYEASGAINGPLGLATDAETCGLAGAGCTQPFAGGAMYWSAATGAHLISDPTVLARWTATGGVTGTLGYPTTDTSCDWQQRCTQTFERGSINTATAGSYVVAAPFDTAWADRGGESGVLGSPTGDASCGLAGGGCKQTFAHGTLWSTTATGVHMVAAGDPIATRWTALGAEGGTLGYPTADAVCGLVNGGCKQTFQRGTLYEWSGAFVMAPGPITTAWLAAGAEGSSFGYPTSDVACDPAGTACRQTFSASDPVYWTAAGGVRTVSNRAGSAYTFFRFSWEGHGAETGALGYPTGDVVCGLRDGGCTQRFQRGALYRTPSSGTAMVLDNAIGAHWAAAGFENGPLGYPAGDPTCGLPGGGCTQSFAGNQLVVTSAATGTHVLAAGTRWAWEDAGDAAGPLGYPVGQPFCGLRDGGCGQHFQGGSVYDGPYGASAVHGAIRDFWAARGWENGALGYPMSNPDCDLPGGGCTQWFGSGSTVAWSPATGVHEVANRLSWSWQENDAVRGFLGYPTTDAFCGLRDGGCGQHFQGGSVYAAGYGVGYAIPTTIRDRWGAAGWEWGLGYPAGEAFCGLRDGGCGQHFAGGSIYSSPATGAQVVRGAMRNAWAVRGWEGSPLGYPTGSEVCGLRAGGCFQPFAGGGIYSSPATGVRAVTGTIRDRWAAQGWEGGALGYPTTDAFCGLRDGGCGQHFAGGSIYTSAAGGARIVSGVLRNAWAAQGWEGGALGYPITDAFCGLRDGGCGQHFRGGSVYWSPASGARTVAGPIAARWAAQGWEWGLGYPTTDAFCGLRDGGCGQHFQYGSVYWSPATGAHAVSGALRDQWAARGWEWGLGYPTGGATTSGQLVTQAFQRGALTVAI